MSNCVLFAIPGNEVLTNSLTKLLNAETGEVIIRHRPDGETYIKVLSNVYEKEAIIICSLHHPDDKILPLYFLAKTLKELRAYPVTLVVPYLAYMQQDRSLASGECISSDFFGQLLSFFVDKLITVDLQLHSNNSLNKIYSIHTSVLNISSKVSRWIKENIHAPLLIASCKEKEQLLSQLAEEADAPCITLEKKGKADKSISAIQVEKYKDYTPVLVDNVIATGSTMVEIVTCLRKAGMKAPVCIAVHTIPGGKANVKLIKAGAKRMISCNTIIHPSNVIYIDELLAQEICKNSFVID